MFNFLHYFSPQPILFSFGPLTVYWYGFFVVLGMIVALSLTFHLAKYYHLRRETIFDLSFWLIIGGLLGARLYDIGLNLPYYFQHPWQTLAIWKGGLAIHGGIIAGLLIIYFFSRRQKINFWKLSALIVPGLAFAQAIGRWGNYFNQELFGRPTNLPWGIPVNPLNRPAEYIANRFFHPTFLYESLGCLAIGSILLAANVYLIRRQKLNERRYVWLTALYMILYSILRFSLEFIRIDATPSWLGLRWPQIISLAIIIFSVAIIFNPHVFYKKN
ncbi:TPA: prolipoprotein diacylglyceryl transferase [Candidatus Falkowbacteria bacterium]|nr:MAG: Prolipoprotein diacylglyceryl transferase [Candidatus Falkowbacteria bacterium GW2011_GWF2_43_32]HBA37059.1 prolipoprotein diacylglyceryl transferase [Candidatus Falkowbacteria bacterium]